MAKPLKITAAIFGTLLALLVLAALLLPLLFDPNDYRKDLAAAIERQTGRSFSVGHIQLDVIPWLRVSLKDVALGNAKGFSSSPMLSVSEAGVGIRLWPLLTGRALRTETIHLKGLRAVLEVNGQGLSNWADLLARQKKQAGNTEQRSGLGGLDLAGIEITDAALRLDDAQQGKHYQVDALSLSTGRIHGAQPIGFELAANLACSSPATTAHIESAGSLSYEAVTGSVKLGTLHIGLEAALAPSAPAAGYAMAIRLDAASLEYQGISKLLSTTPITLTIDRLVQGDTAMPMLSAKGSLRAAVSADFINSQYALRGVDAAVELTGSSVPGGKSQRLRLVSALQADLKANTASLQATRLEAYGLQISSQNLAVAALTSDQPGLGGDLAIAPFEPRKLLASLGIAAPKMADTKALTSAQMHAQLSASKQALALRDLLLKLDETTVQGMVSASGFGAASAPRYQFTLAADSLNADRYLPPRVEPPAGEAPVKRLDVKSLEAPLKTLEQLNADGSLKVGRLTFKGVLFTDALLRLGPNVEALVPKTQAARPVRRPKR